MEMNFQLIFPMRLHSLLKMYCQETHKTRILSSMSSSVVRLLYCVNHILKPYKVMMMYRGKHTTRKHSLDML